MEQKLSDRLSALAEKVRTLREFKNGYIKLSYTTYYDIRHELDAVARALQAKDM